MRKIPQFVLILVFIVLSTAIVGAAPAQQPVSDYRAPNWRVNVDPNTCLTATIGGIMPHDAPMQVLVYAAGTSQPVYAHVFPMTTGGGFRATVMLNDPLQRWFIVELTAEPAPWLMYSGEVDCTAAITPRQ